MKSSFARIAILALIASILVLPSPAAAAPPAPTITGYPQGAVGSPDAAFSFFSPGAGSYQCRVFEAGTDPVNWSSCTGGFEGSHRVTGLPDGDWAFQVRAAQGEVFSDPSTREWTVSSDPVVQWIVEPTGTFNTRYVTATFSAPGATRFECKLNGATTSCGSGQQGMWLSGGTLPDGDYDLTVRAQDAGGEWGPEARASFTVTVDAPAGWVSKPSGTYDTAHVAAVFMHEEANWIMCRAYRTDPVPTPLPSFAQCGGGGQGSWTSPTLANGDYQLDVQAVDTTGPRPTESANFTIDVPLQVEWITSPTAGPYAAASFRADGAWWFQCRVYRTDPVPTTLPGFTSCSSGPQGSWTSPTLADGGYRLEVVALDQASKAGPVASADFTIDVPLEIEWIASPSAGPYAAATFRADGAWGFQCRAYRTDPVPTTLPGFTSCSSGPQGSWTSPTLADGGYRLEVAALDQASKAGPVASTDFAIGSPSGTGLAVSVTSGPAAGSTIGSSWAAFAWSALDAYCFQAALDAALPTEGTCSHFPSGPKASYYSLADGEHTLLLRARSAGGTWGPVTEHRFAVDTSAVTTVSVTSGPAAGSTIGSSWAAFAWSAPDAYCFQAAFDAALPTEGTCTHYPAGPKASYYSLADGEHTLLLRARSIGGTWGPVTEHRFAVDTSAVTTVSVTSGPAAGSTIGSAWTAFAWFAPDAYCYQAVLDAALPSGGTCTHYPSSPKNTYENLADGGHTLMLRARSVGGDWGPVTEHRFTVDTSAATTVSVTSGPAAGSTIGSAWAAFAWSAPAAYCYQVAFDAALPTNGTCTYYPSSPKDWYQNLADGEHTLLLRARSVAGSWGPVTEHRFTVQSGPWVTVSSRPRQVLPSGTAAFAWSAPDAYCYQAVLDAALPTDGTCSHYPSSPTSTYGGLADGGHTLLLRARSVGGTWGAVVSTTFTVEAKAPQTAMTAAPPEFHNSTTAQFEFTSDEPSTFQCRLDAPTGAGPDDGWQECSSPWQRTLGEGPHRLEVRAVDMFANPDPTPEVHEWVIDTRAPVLVDIDLNGSRDDGVVLTSPDAVLTYSFDEPVVHSCRLTPPDTAAFAECGTTKLYEDLADGTYTFEVKATDRAGNESLTATRSWTVTTKEPETLIAQRPADLVNVTTATIGFESPDAPVTFECKQDAEEEFTTCAANPLTLTGLGQGEHRLEVRAVKGGTLRDPSPAVVTWTVDSIAPVVTIIQGPSGPTGPGRSVFTFTANEPGVTFTCQLDGNAPQACPATVNAADLGPLDGGPHTLWVFGTDPAGNASAPPVQRDWVVDDVAPVVEITGAPADPTNVRTGSLATFTVDDPTAAVDCRVNGGAWTQDCSSPFTIPALDDGRHTFEVQAFDAAANHGHDSASWTLDTVAPTVTITTGPAGGSRIKVTSATYGFTVSEPAATECRVDGGEWAACSSEHLFADLAEGTRTLQIRATDPAGNRGDPAQRTVIVDTTAPTVTFTGGPSGPVSDPDATVTFLISELAATECSFDDPDGAEVWTSCMSPFERTGLGEGPHILRVRATDLAGNTGPVAIRQWIVDTVEPDTLITAGPPAATNQTTASFGFASDPDGADFECRVDSTEENDWAACGSNPLVVGGLGDGPHTFEVRAVLDGLTDPTPAKVTWTVDTTAPVITVTAKPTGTATVASSQFTFSVDDPAADLQCQVDETAWVACASPFDPRLPGPSLPDGPHAVSIRATDAADNQGLAGPFHWVVDGAAPDVTIMSGPAHNSTITTPTTSFTFTVDDPDAVVQCRLQPGPDWAACAPEQPLSVGPLDDDQYTFSVRAIDAAGNVGGEGRTFILDSTAPVVRITSGPTGTTTSTTAVFTYTVDDPTATVQCQLASAWGPCPDPLEYTLAEGSHTFWVRATDPHGNEGSDFRGWIVDLTPPAVTITDGPSGSVADNDVAFEFDADEPVDFECRLDSSREVDWASCGSGTTGEQTYPDLATGPHTFEVRGIDAAELVGAAPPRTFTVDILGNPDLELQVRALDQAGSPIGTAELGDVFLIRASATNEGVATAQDTMVTVPLSSAFRLGGPLPAGCTSPDTDGPVTCDVGTVAVGATKSVDIPVKGVLTCTVFGDSSDNAGPAGELVGTPGADVICGGGGSDDIRGRGGLDTIYGYGPAGAVTTSASATYGPGGLAATAEAPASVTIDGTDGDDRITTGTLRDIIHGQDGNDTIVAGAGDDIIYGGPGGDVIDGGTGDNTVDGGPGGDQITTGSGLDTVTGGDGDDIIKAGAGDNVVDGGAGDDQITTGGGLDTVTGGGGGDIISTGGGDDYVDGGPGPDEINAGNGNNFVDGGADGDQITTAGGDDTVIGGDGDDIINAGGGDNVVDGGSDQDRITTGGGLDTVTGGGGGDIISTGGGDDYVDGGPGPDEINAGNGNNFVDGGADGDQITTAGGDDTVIGGDGDDIINAGAGDNVLDGGSGADQITAGNGVDTISGGPGDDYINAGGGHDTAITGDEGNDTVHGGAGNDNLDGGEGDDRLVGEGGSDVLRGGIGNDILDGGDGEDILRGNAGNDTLYGGGAADTVIGGPGNDHADGGAGADRVYGDNFDDGGPNCVPGADGPECADDGHDVVRGGAGNDVVVNGQGGNDFVYGDDGNDLLLLGGSGNDQIFGGAGNDVLDGADGDDTLIGDQGADTMSGGAGDDMLDGREGKDILRGNAGHDTLYGGADADTVIGGPGNDFADGGTGVDEVYGDNFDDAGPNCGPGANGPECADDGNDVVRGGDGNDLVVNGQGGNDHVYGDGGNDPLVIGGSGDDHVYGGAGNDNVYGNDGDDHLYGEEGKDILLGGRGNDRLLGGDQDDYLSGADGNDYLNGQLGRDVLRGGDGDDELDGGPASWPKDDPAGKLDHWNRLYGDGGDADICHFGPGLDAQMTNYRDASCELRDVGLIDQGQGWLNGSKNRGDRGASDPANYPG